MNNERHHSRTNSRRHALIAACTAALFASAPIGISTAQAGDLVLASGGANARLDVKSMADRKYTNVVRQQFDFSCGSAALATLLTYHYDKPTNETDAFKSMWEVGDQERIRKLGFSLLEMKKYLEVSGLLADGFQLSLDRIGEIGVPGIALVDVKGYRHFVVVKGLTKETVLIGDPSAGIKSMPRHEFEEHWDGVILFIRSNVKLGKANFNKIDDWRLTPTAPYDRPVDIETLQSFSINQTRPSFSGIAISSIMETR